MLKGKGGFPGRSFIMGEFAIKHPWITALLIVPTVVHGSVRLVTGIADAISNASRPSGEKDRKKDELS